MDYRIVCTEQEPAQNPPKHAHIVAVGTGTDPDKADQRLTLTQVIQKMDNGDRFYTKGLRTGKIAWVEKYWCSYCRQHHIRSSPDATTDNNLDSLRYCSWKS
ncbi:MAG: DUF3892 domain-containing protein [Crenarchaeota archaeon]|nr:DUF3892 domain-containing protein [Thermoproteota archaeon]